jgi:hypothetical protein
MNPRKKSKEKKVYVQGRVNKDVYDEFIQNALQFKGPKHGHAGLSLEEAMRLFNNYFRQYDTKSLIDVAREEGIDPNEIGIRMVKMFMHMNLELGVRTDSITKEEHLEFVKKHFKDKNED